MSASTIFLGLMALTVVMTLQIFFSGIREAYLGRMWTFVRAISFYVIAHTVGFCVIMVSFGYAYVDDQREIWYLILGGVAGIAATTLWRSLPPVRADVLEFEALLNAARRDKKRHRQNEWTRLKSLQRAKSYADE